MFVLSLFCFCVVIPRSFPLSFHLPHFSYFSHLNLPAPTPATLPLVPPLPLLPCWRAAIICHSGDTDGGDLTTPVLPTRTASVSCSRSFPARPLGSPAYCPPPSLDVPLTLSSLKTSPTSNLNPKRLILGLSPLFLAWLLYGHVTCALTGSMLEGLVL